MPSAQFVATTLATDRLYTTHTNTIRNANTSANADKTETHSEAKIAGHVAALTLHELAENVAKLLMNIVLYVLLLPV